MKNIEWEHQFSLDDKSIEELEKHNIDTCILQELYGSFLCSGDRLEVIVNKHEYTFQFNNHTYCLNHDKNSYLLLYNITLVSVYEIRMEPSDKVKGVTFLKLL